jgi:hypothetical protein
MMNIGTISAIGRPFGLAFASGINAYLPMLALALADRWFHLFAVNPIFGFITQTWCIVVLIVLTVVDFVADKIPFVDHVWNAVHKVVRPIMGAIVAAASINHIPAIVTVPNSEHMVGIVVAALSDTPIIAVGLVIVLFIPLIMLILIVLFVLVLGPRLLRVWSRFPGRRWL